MKLCLLLLPSNKDVCDCNLNRETKDVYDKLQINKIIKNAHECGFSKIVIVRSESDNSNSIVDYKGIDVKIINLHKSKSWVPKWLKPQLSNEMVIYGDNHSLLYAKPYINEPFIVLDTSCYLSKEILFELYQKAISLQGLNRTYFSVCSNNHLRMDKGNAILCKTDFHLNLQDFSDCYLRTIKSQFVLNELNVLKHINELCCLNIWLLTPDYFELSEMQFESFLIEKEESEDKNFKIHKVMNDLLLKDMVTCRAIVLDDLVF